MEHLQIQDSLAHYLQNYIYTLGSVQFSDDDKDFARDVEAILKTLQRLQAQTLALADEELRLSAGLRRKLRKLRGAASELESTDEAFRKSPAGKGKRSIFEATVSNIFTVMNLTDRDAALEKLKGKVEAAPDIMKGAAKRFLTAMDELRDVQKLIEGLGKKVAALAVDVEAAKTAAITHERRLEGKLNDRHAEEPEEAELPFRPTVKKAKKEDAKKADPKKDEPKQDELKKDEPKPEPVKPDSDEDDDDDSAPT